MEIEREREPLSDEEIAFDVRETLRWDLRIDDTNVRVAVRCGVAHLSGRLPSLAERQAAGEDAARIKGVRSVDNKLAVQPPALRRDEDIARESAMALARDRRLEASQVSVVVNKGIATLAGTVATVAEHRAAREDVWYTAGVVDLVDELRVVPRAPRSDAQIVADVSAALAIGGRIADPARIAVEAQEGSVYLRGNVEDERERHAAEDLAGLIGGVVDVVDELVINPL